MSLRLQFTLDQLEILYQQDVHASVVLNNVGANPIDVSVPPLDVRNPIVYLTNIQNGEEDTFQRTPAARATDLGPMSLAAGTQLRSEFHLFDVLPALQPGHYDIRIAWLYNNGVDVAESETLRLKVLPTTPKNMCMSNAVGGSSEIKYSVWLNLAGDPNAPPDIIRNRFSFAEGGGVSELMRVAPASVSSKPVLSSPMVSKVAASQWVAWLNNNTLHFCHVDEELGVSDPTSLPVAFEGIEIVPPLYSAEVVDTSVRPLGGVLLQHALTEGAQFRLDTVQLTVGEAKALGHLIVSGNKPVWSMSHVRSKQQWLVTYLQEQNNGLLLSYCSWPGFPAENSAPVNLALWHSQFISANACISADDTIYGGILMWKLPKDKPRRLVLESWTLEGDNIKTQEFPLVWPPNQLIKDARVGVSDTGLLVALLADQEGSWFVTVAGSEFKPLPVEIQKTRQALDIAFMEGNGDPLLLYGSISRGFRILQLDGSPLPPPIPK